jgi:hypothetical protein
MSFYLQNTKKNYIFVFFRNPFLLFSTFSFSKNKIEDMFSAFANPFHKTSERPLSEKGLSGVLYYSNKSSKDVAQLADDNRVSANNLMTYGALLGDDLTVSCWRF